MRQLPNATMSIARYWILSVCSTAQLLSLMISTEYESNFLFRSARTFNAMSVLLSANLFPSPKISFPSPFFVSPTYLLFSLLILLTFPFSVFLSLYWPNTFPLQIFYCSCLLCLNSTHPPLSNCFPSHNICNIFLFSFPLLTKYFRSPNIFPLILFFSCADRMYNFFKRYTLWTFSSSQKYTLLQKNPLCKCKASSVLKFPFVAHFISRWNEQNHLYLFATSFFS